YEDGNRKASRRKIQKKAGMLGYRREEMDRERWIERRSGSWSGARANDGGPCMIRGRRGRRGCFLCRSGGGKAWWAGTCGGWSWSGSARMEGMLRLLCRVVELLLTPRLGYIVQLELHHCSALLPLAPFSSVSWSHTLTHVSWVGSFSLRVL
ncbi:hypothetical protein B0H13DRAFT_2130652, partial [Mycena leptocephala]